MVSRVWGIGDDFLSTPPGSGSVQIQQCGQLNPSGLLHRPDDTLQSVNILFGGWTAPHCDGWGDDRLNDSCVKLHHQLLGLVELPQLTQEVHALLNSFDYGAGIVVPLHVPGDCCAQELTGFYGHHCSVENSECWQGWRFLLKSNIISTVLAVLSSSLLWLLHKSTWSTTHL